MITEVALPIENLKKKLRNELKATEISYGLADGADPDFNYLSGKADGLRLALYIISKTGEK
jgi:hypothetical protein